VPRPQPEQAGDRRPDGLADGVDVQRQPAGEVPLHRVGRLLRERPRHPVDGGDLAGCVNDARDWAEELTKRGFGATLLLDADATGDAMREGIRRELRNAASGDVVVITYSGHGTWVPDLGGDEPDRRDEALCPYDLSRNGPLLDDELHDILADRERGVRVVMISDPRRTGSGSCRRARS
jgi:hypothetical protein